MDEIKEIGPSVEDTDRKKIGLIAGYGSFPLELTAVLNDEGYEVHATAVHEETSKEIESITASTTWLHVGQLNAMIKAFKHQGVDKVIMAGKVKKLHLFRNFRPDFVAMKMLLSIPDRRDDSILLAIADLLKKNNLTLQSQVEYAGDMLATSGQLFGPKVNRKQLKDMLFGFSQAKVIAGLDIGQTIVVQETAVLAVEAIEGTDEAIARGGQLGNGKAVVIKVAKPNQDLRFDVPAIGPDTIQKMFDSGCTAIAVESSCTLLLERQRMAELADQYGISVYALDEEAIAHG